AELVQLAKTLRIVEHLTRLLPISRNDGDDGGLTGSQPRRVEPHAAVERNDGRNSRFTSTTANGHPSFPHGLRWRVIALRLGPEYLQFDLIHREREDALEVRPPRRPRWPGK